MPAAAERRPGTKVPETVENGYVPLAILISGRGSNLLAIIDAIRDGRLRARIDVVISNRPEAPGLDHARAAGVDVKVMSHRDYPSRDDYDDALAGELRRRGVALVCLAGFMRLLGPRFCAAFPQRILNVHPSLLPAFPGVGAQQQALDHGVKLSGVTVHLVTPSLDDGPIVAQTAVPVQDDDTVESLSARILVEEHRLYPDAIAKIAGGGWRIAGRRVIFEPTTT
jgi:phosphoribosylglycinamide formyltransferase-1